MEAIPKAQKAKPRIPAIMKHKTNIIPSTETRLVKERWLVLFRPTIPKEISSFIDSAVSTKC